MKRDSVFTLTMLSSPSFQGFVAAQALVESRSPMFGLTYIIKQTTKQHTNVFHLEFRTSFQSFSVRPISQCFCDLDRPRNVLRPNQCCWKLRCVCILEPWHSLPESLACLSGIALCSSLPYIPLPSQNDLVKNPEPSSNLNSVGAGAGNGTQNDIVEILKP